MCYWGSLTGLQGCAIVRNPPKRVILIAILSVTVFLGTRFNGNGSFFDRPWNSSGAN